MKEWDQDAVKAVIININKEIQSLQEFNCYHCKDFPMDNINNNICEQCRLNKQYELIKCNERLLLWKNRLIEQEK